VTGIPMANVGNRIAARRQHFNIGVCRHSNFNISPQE
jgi:hypothetical protein